ncbi:MAG: helix-turn-helix domain-containing protein, partial [Spirochaetaceae bacterium]
RVGSLISEEAVVAWVHSLPRLAPDEATSLSDLLSRIALSCCDPQGYEHLRGTGKYEIGSELSGYLEYLTSMEGEKRSAMRYPIEKEPELLDCVTAGDRQGAEQVLRELVTVVSGLKADHVEEARSRVLELVVLLSRAAIAGGADVELVFGFEYRSLSRLRTLSSLDEVSAWLSRILTRFVDLVFDLRHVRYSAHLSRVLAYLRENFREPITLSEVADAVHLSPGYLGRIFRSELHSSFSRYLQRMRIQEAKRLLRRTSMPVGDVGAASGFSDHSYFSQLFRRETGLAPREYRQTPTC